MTLKGGFSGSATKRFPIERADLAATTIGAIADQNYTGQDIQPVFDVTFGGNAVSADEFTASWADNKEMGTATLTITANDDSAHFKPGSTNTITFTIKGTQVTLDNVSVEGSGFTYTRLPINPVVVKATINGAEVTLVEGTDYTIDFGTAGNVNAGKVTYTVKPVAGSGFEIPAEGLVVDESSDKAFTIAPAVISSVEVAETDLAYTGSDLAPTVTVKATGGQVADDSEGAEEGATKAAELTLQADEYSLTYNGAAALPKAAGDYTVAAVPESTNFVNGDPAASVTATVAKADLNGVAVDGVKDAGYTGTPVTQEFTVAFNGLPVSDDEYTVSYENNNAKGTATLVLTAAADGNFTGTKRVDFEIGAADLSDTAHVTVAPIPDQEYTGSAIEPEVIVTYDGRQLTSADYVVESIDNNIQVGVAVVTVAANQWGNFVGKQIVSFNIMPASIAAATISASDVQLPETGTVEPVVSVALNGKNLTLGTDFKCSYAAAGDGASLVDGKPATAGTYTVTATGTGNYTGTTAAATFKVTTDEVLSIADEAKYTVTATGTTGLAYNGTAHTPAVAVTKVEDGSALTEGTDYTVEYQNNTNAGTAGMDTSQKVV